MVPKATLVAYKKLFCHTYYDMYNTNMKFTWNETKSSKNIKKHGFDFADAEQVFNGPTMTVEDIRDYVGE